MAKRVVTTVICDMPHDLDVEGAFPVSITTPDGTWSLDLCPDHAAVLLPIVAAVPGVRGKRVSAKV